MQVIEALFIGVEEPHDYLHIKHERAHLTDSSARSNWRRQPHVSRVHAPRPRSPSVTDLANSGQPLVAGCGRILIGLS
jgi:hypothetical protein